MKISAFIKGFKKGMHDFGQNVAVIVNSILLLIVYFIGVGVTSIVAKIKGKKFFETKISRSKKSYWSDLTLKKKPLEKYYRQF